MPQQLLLATFAVPMWWGERGAARWYTFALVVGVAFTAVLAAQASDDANPSAPLDGLGVVMHCA